MSDKESSRDVVELKEAAPWMDDGMEFTSPLRNNDVYYKEIRDRNKEEKVGVKSKRILEGKLTIIWINAYNYKISSFLWKLASSPKNNEGTASTSPFQKWDVYYKKIKRGRKKGKEAGRNSNKGNT